MPTIRQVERDRKALRAIFKKHQISDISLTVHRADLGGTHAESCAVIWADLEEQANAPGGDGIVHLPDYFDAISRIPNYPTATGPVLDVDRPLTRAEFNQVKYSLDQLQECPRTRCSFRVQIADPDKPEEVTYVGAYDNPSIP